MRINYPIRYIQKDLLAIQMAPNLRCTVSPPWDRESLTPPSTLLPLPFPHSPHTLSFSPHSSLALSNTNSSPFLTNQSILDGGDGLTLRLGATNTQPTRWRHCSPRCLPSLDMPEDSPPRRSYLGCPTKQTKILYGGGPDERAESHGPGSSRKRDPSEPCEC